MEEQGGESRESKYRRIQYNDDMLPEPPEGLTFTYHTIQTDTGEKNVPLTIGGHPIYQVKPGCGIVDNFKFPGGIPLEVKKDLFPDYDEDNPSDPKGSIPRSRLDTLQPFVFIDAAHEKRVLDWRAAAIQREADLKRRREKIWEDYYNRKRPANSYEAIPISSGTKADQNLGESTSTMV